MRCSARTKSGKRCKGHALPGKKKCFFHARRTGAGKRTTSGKKELSSGERFLRRQAVGKGTEYGAPYVSLAGYEMSKWASQPRAPPKYIRSTLHQKHNIKHKGVDYSKPLRRKGLVKENPTGRAYGYKTDHRTRPRSGTGMQAARVVRVTGNVMPILGAAWVMHDLVSQYYGGPELGARATGLAKETYSTTKSNTERVAYGVKAAVQAYKQLPLPLKLLTAAAVNTI